MGRFAEVFRRKGLKVNASKNKDEGLECEVYVDGIH